MSGQEMQRNCGSRVKTSGWQPDIGAQPDQPRRFFHYSAGAPGREAQRRCWRSRLLPFVLCFARLLGSVLFMATQESAAGKTLVLHAPPSKFSGPGKTFEAMLSSGFAVGYILSDDAVA